MSHPTWPLFDLRVRTPRLELRYIDDELATELSVLATNGIHDPGFMPFSMPWSQESSPALERNTMQFYWRCRAETTPAHWSLNLATLVDGVVVGTTGLMADDFPTLRVFETGSWLGREYQGKGIGKEMRAASLHLGFLGLDAQFATTSAWLDNGPSLGVTKSLGYTPTGRRRSVRQDLPSEMHLYEMARADFTTHLQRDDIEMHGLPAAREQLGLDAT